MAKPERAVRGLAAGAAVAAAGLALLILASRMDQGWADRHFLPCWAYEWPVQLRILAGLRAATALAGLAVLLVAAPWARRSVAAGRGGEALAASAGAALAVIAALAATEAILQLRARHADWDRISRHEPLRIRDAELGWRFAPQTERAAIVSGRRIHYAIGRFGYRAASSADAPDFSRPAILLAGESIVFGYGLDWRDTIGARLQARTGIRAVNIAVDAYATDQVLMRLRRELPRFARPAAVVIPFLPRLLDRNLDRDRPHLDSRLRWHAAGRPPLRIVALARRAIRYRSEAEMVEGVAMTRAALAEAMRLARARGAQPILLVPQYLPESPRERDIRILLLDRARLPYLLVPIPPQWRNPVDKHPDPRGARAMADAIAARLVRR